MYLRNTTLSQQLRANTKKTFHLSLVSIGYVYLKNSLSYANLNYEFHISSTSDK